MFSKKPIVDVKKNRRSQQWSRRELAGRLLWTLVFPLFRLSPRLLWGWRRLLLRTFGAHIGPEVQINPTVRVTIPWNLNIGEECALGDGAILYALGPIKIGARVTISQGAHLCAGTHEWRCTDMPLVRSPIQVESDVWICADAFIGPNVKLGRGAIVGARAVAVRDVPSGVIVAGNPAREIGRRNNK